MSSVEVVLAIVLGLLVNELTDVSPWLARKLVGWSARLRYRDTSRAEVRAEELAAVINDRPGKLFKLGTGLRFLSAALAIRLRRAVTGESPSADAPGSEILSASILSLDAEPTTLVARYLFPGERYRGEWRRHWINPVKSICVIALYAVLGVWAAVARIAPRYVGWVVAAIIVTALLLMAYRMVGWFFARFVITNKRLMSTEGVFTRRVAMMPLMRVVDVRYVQSAIARVLNYGTFQLESADRRNALRRIADLPNPNELYLRLVEEIYEPAAVEARVGEDSTGEPGTEADGDPDEAPARPDPLVVQREIIHQIGALSAQLATLAATIQRLSPAADEATEQQTGVPEAGAPDTPEPVGPPDAIPAELPGPVTDPAQLPGPVTDPAELPRPVTEVGRPLIGSPRPGLAD